MKIGPLSNEDRLDWLQLIRCENIGPRTFAQLVQRHGAPGAALRALPEIIAKGRGRPIRLAERDEILREFAIAERLGARFVAICEPDYPESLRAIAAPPPLIAVKGDVGLLKKPCAAVVGSRNASATGLSMAEKLALGLGAAGFVVVSGLARGIDARAHRAALATGTIGVLAGGLDKPYPPENLSLIDEVFSQGAVVSEMPFGYEPRGRDFPRRNRLVAGLSLGVVVAEAARRSGSLITARFAQEQNREIFAVPGSPLDPRAEGTLDLLRDGALFCTDARDMVEVLRTRAERGAAGFGQLFEDEAPYEPEPLWDEWDWDGARGPVPPIVDIGFFDSDGMGDAFGAPPLDGGAAQWGADPGETETLPEKIAALLGPTPIDVDELARLIGKPARAVRLAMQELELDGVALRLGGDRFMRNPAS